MAATQNPFEAIANAFANMARKELAAKRAADAARPVGTRALSLGVTDYRKQPNQRIDSTDWAVWLVEWTGREWKRVKRLTANQSLEGALNSISRLCKERCLPRSD